MITRSLLTLFTALLLGASLSAPLASAMGEGYGSGQSLAVTPLDGPVLPVQLTDTESDEGLDPLAPVPGLAVRTAASGPLPSAPALARRSERPPVRASPVYL